MPIEGEYLAAIYTVDKIIYKIQCRFSKNFLGSVYLPSLLTKLNKILRPSNFYFGKWVSINQNYVLMDESKWSLTLPHGTRNARRIFSLVMRGDELQAVVVKSVAAW